MRSARAIVIVTVLLTSQLWGSDGHGHVDSHVHYHLTLPATQRKEAEAAFDNYMTRCPAAMSVIDAIKIMHQLEMSDEP